jgi:predicted glycoside hydrolase/deacetylase ChbG (UPF0249 family)
VHADDLGLSPGVDLAIRHGFESGTITSASILVAGASAREALAWAAKHPEHDFGVHLNLTHGAPTLPAQLVPGLVDRHGRFRPKRRLLARLLLGRVPTGEILAEWNAQIEAVVAAGVRISQLDSHHHVHLLPSLFRGAAAPLARERGLALRTMDGPAGFVGGRLDAKGILLAYLSRWAARGGVAGLSAARGTGTALAGSPDVRVLRSLLRRMEAGSTYELVVHPGYADRALRESGDAYVEGREAERRFLESEETRALLSSAMEGGRRSGPDSRRSTRP